MGKTVTTFVMGLLMLFDKFSENKKVTLVSLEDLPPRPKGRLKVEEGDKIYHYDSNDEQWKIGFGSEGYAVVRDGEVVDEVMCKMS